MNLITSTHDEGIGLEVGMASEFRDSGIMGYASWSGPNQRENLERLWNRYGRFVGLMTKVFLTPAGSHDINIDIDLDIDIASLPDPKMMYRFFVEELIGMFVKVGADMNGCAPISKKLEVIYTSPAYSDRYTALLKCPIAFNQSRTRLTVPRPWFDQPLLSADRELSQLFTEKLEQFERQICRDGHIRTRVLDILRQHQNKPPSLDDVAKQLGMTSRTLSRQLLHEGTAFSQIADDIRSQIAITIVKNGRVPVKKIADRLGFENVNGFRRAFKRWTGVSVSEYRASGASAVPVRS
jgi:AraC-like DNA-binding protein